MENNNNVAKNNNNDTTTDGPVSVKILSKKEKVLSFGSSVSEFSTGELLENPAEEMFLGISDDEDFDVHEPEPEDETVIARLERIEKEEAQRVADAFKAEFNLIFSRYFNEQWLTLDTKVDLVHSSIETAIENVLQEIDNDLKSVTEQKMQIKALEKAIELDCLTAKQLDNALRCKDIDVVRIALEFACKKGRLEEEQADILMRSTDYRMKLLLQCVGLVVDDDDEQPYEDEDVGYAEWLDACPPDVDLDELIWGKLVKKLPFAA
jgi:hypothetical protein